MRFLTHLSRSRSPRAFQALLVGTWLAMPAMQSAAQITANLLSLHPVRGVSYQPSPSDDSQFQSQQCTVYNAVYYDTDF